MRPAHNTSQESQSIALAPVGEWVGVGGEKLGLDVSREGFETRVFVA